MLLTIQGKSGYGADPDVYIADMLRYDGGEIMLLREFDRGQFFAIIECERYTPDRWLSFGLRTDQLFTDMPYVYFAPTTPKVYHTSDYDDPDEDCRDCGHLDCCGTHNEDCFFS